MKDEKQEWEEEFDHLVNTQNQIDIHSIDYSFIEKLKKFITSTRLSAVQDYQEDRRRRGACPYIHRADEIVRIYEIANKYCDEKVIDYAKTEAGSLIQGFKEHKLMEQIKYLEKELKEVYLDGQKIGVKKFVALCKERWPQVAKNKKESDLIELTMQVLEEESKNFN